MTVSASDLDIVFLLPGFLGFEKFEDFAYFGDRFGTGLRASLAPRVEQQLQVVAIPLPPTSSLAERQLALSKTIVERTRKIIQMRGVPDVRGIHLVGHSTGGVDAHLLTLARPLNGASWSKDSEWLRSKIKSVISLASPHQGSCLAQDRLAQLVESSSPLEFFQHAAGTLLEVVAAAKHLVPSLPGLAQDPEFHQLIASVVSSHVAWSFVRDIFRSRALIDDLMPKAAIERYSQHGAPLQLLRRSFVTVAAITPTAVSNVVESAVSQPPERATPREDPPSAPPDALFLLLSQLTSGRATDCLANAPLKEGSVAALQRTASKPNGVIAASRALLPPAWDAAVNDGVVNAARQLINPKDPDELVAIVVADHFDVVGHYDRQLFVTDPKTGELTMKAETSGLLHSGSHFRDDQFFELIERMANAMLPAFA